MHLSDKQLIERFTNDQDEDAFEQLVRRHSTMVWGVCRRLLWRTQDAEDAYQVTFILLSTHAKRLLEYRSMGGWLHETAVRTCLNIRRQVCRNREMNIEHAPLNHEVEPWQKIALARDQELLHQAIVELPKRYREVVVLCLLEGKTRAEAASIIQCTKSAVKAALSRGRRLLRTKLLKQGVGASVVLTVLSASSIANAASQLSSPIQSLPPAEPLIQATIRACTSTQSQLPSALSPLVQSLTHNKFAAANGFLSPSVMLASAAIVLAALLAGTGLSQFDWPKQSELQITIPPGTAELTFPVHLERVLLSEPPQEDDGPAENPLISDFRTRQKAALRNELNLMKDQLGLSDQILENIWELVQADLDEVVRQYSESFSTKTRTVIVSSDRIQAKLQRAVWEKAKAFVAPEKVANHKKLATDASELHQTYHASSQQEVVWFLDHLLSLSAEQRSKVEKNLAEVWDPEWTALFQGQIGFSENNTCEIIGSLENLRTVLNPKQQKVFDSLPLFAAVSYPDCTNPNATVWNSLKLEQLYRSVIDLRLDRMETRYQLSDAQIKRLNIARKGAMTKTIAVWEDTYKRIYGEQTQLQGDELHSYLNEHPLSRRCITDQCTSSQVWATAIKNVLNDQQYQKWNADQELDRQAYRQWIINCAAFVISSNTSLTLEQHQQLVKVLSGVDVDQRAKPTFYLIEEIDNKITDEKLAEIRQILSDSQATEILSWFTS